MSKARKLGYIKPYKPNNRADRYRGNPFSGRPTTSERIRNGQPSKKEQ